MNNRNLKIHIFYCSNSLESDQLARGLSNTNGIEIKTICLPCSGKINIPYLMKAFETGADGAIIVTCKQNECQHLEGNLRAQKRAEVVESLLKEIGLGNGRMAVIVLKDGGLEHCMNEINRFINSVKKLTLPNQIAVSIENA